MTISNRTDAARLRIYIGNDDTYGDRPLCEAILGAARDARLAGATVSRAIAGYGGSALVHEIVRGFSRDVPVVIEIIDRPDRIDAWLTGAAAMLRNGLVTLETVQVLQFPARGAAQDG